MSTSVLPVPLGPQWIISRNQDLAWFIGSALVSYLVLAMLLAGAPLLPFLLVWILCIDGPHVVATTTRTYFDPAARRKLGLWLWAIVPACLFGPAAVLTGHAGIFYLFAVAWQHFHIAKQHFGFVMLYKHKNGERDRTDYWIDRVFLLSSTVVPLAWFIASTQLKNARPVADLLAAIYIVIGLVFGARQFWKWRATMPLNAPKLLLFAVLAPLQWLAFWHAAQYGPNGIVRAGILLGMFHSFQYHRLLWFHNRNRYSGGGGSLASLLSSKFVYYAAVAIGLNFLLNFLPATVFSKLPLIPAACWGLAFTHYILDARIWRVRGDKELAVALRLR